MAYKRKVEFEVDEIPLFPTNVNGKLSFQLCISNDVEDEDSYQAISEISKIWDADMYASLYMNIRFRDIAINLMDGYTYSDNTYDKEDAPKFDALRNDCVWILQQLDRYKLKD